MERILEPVKFPVVRDIPQQDRLIKWLKMGARIAGGFPVWLAGYGKTYGDIDIYADSWDTFAWIKGELHSEGKYLGDTRETSQYLVRQTKFQLVNPFEDKHNVYDLISDTDMTATATALILDDDKDNDKLVVISLYPEDLRNHTTRVIINHEWTDYRALSYKSRGFTILNMDGSPYQIKKLPMPWENDTVFKSL